MSILRGLKSVISNKLDPENIFNITTTNGQIEVSIKDERRLKVKTNNIDSNLFSVCQIDNDTKLKHFFDKKITIVVKGEEKVIDLESTPVSPRIFLSPLYLKSYLLSLPETKLLKLNQQLKTKGIESCNVDIIRQLIIEIFTLKPQDQEIVSQIYKNLGGSEEVNTVFLTNSQVKALTGKKLSDNRLKTVYTTRLNNLSGKYLSLKGGSKRKTNIRKHKRKTQKSK
jgi:hypothetical protein